MASAPQGSGDARQTARNFEGWVLCARGAAVTGFSYGVAQVLRLATNLVLTRLLLPEAFGPVALISVLQVGLAMVSDVGLGPSISQHRAVDRYALSCHLCGRGAIVVIVACMQMPGVPGMTYEHAALAAGDSRGMFLCMAAKAVSQTTALLVGASLGGLVGALAAQGASAVVIHLPVILLARKHGTWDAAHDAVFAACAALAIWVVLSANWQTLADLAV